MKKLSLLLSLVLSFTLLAACGAKEKAPEQTGANDGNEGNVQQEEKVNISMQIIWDADSGRGKTVRTILDQFEQENQNISVELVGSSQNSQKLLTQILSGQAPEVLQVGYRDVISLASEQAFKDLSADFMSERDNYYPVVFDLGILDGKLYGVPWNGHAIGLVYNKDMFAEAGITSPPTTWAELYDAAKKLTKGDQYGIGLVGKQHYDLVWNVNQFVVQAGAGFVEDGKVAMNTDAARQALEFYKKLADEVSPPDTATKDGGGVMADFRNGIVAMEFQGPWGVTDIWQNGMPFEVGAALLPVGPAGAGADIGVTQLVMPESIDAKKEEAAKKLIQYLTSKEAQEVLLRGEKGDDGNYYPFRVPMRKDMADTEFLKEHPEFLVFIEGLETPAVAPGIGEWIQIEQEILTAEYNNLITGAKSVDDVLKTIEEKGNAILNQ